MVGAGLRNVLEDGRLLILENFIDELENLNEPQRDKDLCAAVALLAFLGGVDGNAFVLAAAGGCETLGGDAILLLHGLYDR